MGFKINDFKTVKRFCIHDKKSAYKAYGNFSRDTI